MLVHQYSRNLLKHAESEYPLGSSFNLVYWGFLNSEITNNSKPGLDLCKYLVPCTLCFQFLHNLAKKYCNMRNSNWFLYEAHSTSLCCDGNYN